MTPGAGRAPGRPLGASLLLLAILATLYGTLEYLWQAHVSPPPAELPGGAGASWWMMVCLAWTVLLLPGLLVAVVLLPLRKRVSGLLGGSLVCGGGLWPTAVVILDRVSQTRQWAWMGADIGGASHAIRLTGAATVCTLVAMAVWALWLHGWRARFSIRPTAVAGIVVLALLAPLAFWFGRPMPHQVIGDHAAPSGRPDILLLTIDTLRQDAIGSYGGPSAVTLDSLIASGTRYDGWSVSSWTRPSMASLFGGIAPTGTGVSIDHAMRPELQTWVQRLRDEGYVTAAVASNPHLRARFGFNRGFGYFEHSDHVEWLAPVVRSFWGIWLQRQLVDRRETDRGDRVVERAQQWLAHECPRDRPWLLWVHFMDPHLPYHLRGEFGERVSATTPEWIQDLGPEFEDGFFRDLPAVRDGRALTDPAARVALRKLYQREVLFADRQVSRLLGMVRDVSGDRPLLWVLASDHGEEFWDEGGFEHGHTMHESVLRVPLAIGGHADQELPSGRDGGPMRLSDVGPTLLGLLGISDFDATRGADIDDLDVGLRERVLGRDLSLSITEVDSVDCRWPELLAEGTFYGPPRTRLLSASGRDLRRNDHTGAIHVFEHCIAAEDSTHLQPTARERAWLMELDLWRERSANRSQRVEDDPELDRQLRALGYMQ